MVFVFKNSKSAMWNLARVLANLPTKFDTKYKFVMLQVSMLHDFKFSRSQIFVLPKLLKNVSWGSIVQFVNFHLTVRSGSYMGFALLILLQQLYVGRIKF